MKFVKSSLLVKLVILILVVYATVTLVRLRSQINEKDAEIASLKTQVSSLAETGRWNAERCDEVRSEARDLQQRTEKAEAEVVRLKAKLYDYMTAGA